MRIKGWKIVGATFVAMTVLVIAVFAMGGFSETATRLLVRNTAQVAVTFFLFAYAASSLHSIFRSGWTTYLLKNRRYLGVSFALAHAIHFLMLVVLYVWFPDPFRAYLLPVTVIGGGIAYLFLLLMTVTSFDRTAALIGARAWSILHQVGGFYIWVLFTQAYIPRAWNDPGYIPLAAALVLVMLLRVYAKIAGRLRRRRRRNEIAPALHASGRIDSRTLPLN